jgi:hypothetical protein
MSGEPIKAGDECIVIGGALAKSLNAGRRVIVMFRNGSAPVARGELVTQGSDGFVNHGPVWRCRSKDGAPFIRLDGDELKVTPPPDQADFAQSWLQKADAPPTDAVRNADKLVA